MNSPVTVRRKKNGKDLFVENLDIRRLSKAMLSAAIAAGHPYPANLDQARNLVAQSLGYRDDHNLRKRSVAAEPPEDKYPGANPQNARSLGARWPEDLPEHFDDKWRKSALDLVLNAVRKRRLDKAEIIAIVGPEASGKSILCDAVAFALKAQVVNMNHPAGSLALSCPDKNGRYPWSTVVIDHRGYDQKLPEVFGKSDFPLPSYSLWNELFGIGPRFSDFVVFNPDVAFIAALPDLDHVRAVLDSCIIGMGSSMRSPLEHARVVDLESMTEYVVDAEHIPAKPLRQLHAEVWPGYVKELKLKDLTSSPPSA